jgi:hypothetical protein
VADDQPDREHHRGLRKIIKTRRLFPSDDAAIRLIWLATVSSSTRVAAPALAPYAA